MPTGKNAEPLTTSLMVRRATVLLARANELQTESELLKRQSQELLEMARHFHGSPERLAQDASDSLVETVANSGRTLSDALLHFAEFLLRPRHLFRHAR